MLGRGRPFVIEIKNPRRRALDLTKLEKTINKKALRKIQVENLKIASRDTVRKLKHMESAQKVYRVVVKFDRGISNNENGEAEKNFH